jgi:hypothetical protein
MLAQVKQPNFVKDVVAANLQREIFFHSKDLLGFHYRSIPVG